MRARRLSSLLSVLFVVFCTTLIVACGGSKPTPAPAPPAKSTPAPVEPTPPAPTPAPTPEPAPGPPPAPVLQPLRIVGQYPLPGEPLVDRFVIYFSEAIAEPRDASGAVVPAIATNPPTTLAVTVNGNAIVAQVDPASLTRPASYEVSYPVPVRGQSGAQMSGDIPLIRFNVPEPNGAMATGLALDKRTDTDLRLRLRFSLPMNIETLKQSLRVTGANAAEIDFALAPIDGSSDVALVLPKDVPLPVSVSVFPGAPDATGTSPLRAAAAFSFPDAANATMKVVDFRKVITSDPVLRFSIRTTQKIALDTLATALRIVDGTGSAVTVTPTLKEATGYATVTEFELPTTTPLPLQFTLPKDTPAENTLAKLNEDFVALYPAEAPLLVTETVWRVESDGENYVQINFSDSVPLERLKALLKLTPKSGGEALRTEMSTGTQSSARVRLLGAPAELRDLDIEIAAGLEGGATAILKEPYTATITRQASPLGIEYADWDSRGKDGAALRVDLNQPVDLPSMQTAISFDPPVANISVSSSWSRGLMISGDFASAASYTLKVGNSAKSLLGDAVVEETLEFPINESPKVSGAGFDFEDKYYYPRRTSGTVPLQTRNLEEVTVHLSELFPSNIQVALNGIEEGKTWDDFEGRWAKTIATKKIKLPNTPDKRVTTPLDLKELMPAGAKGVFGLRLEPGSNSYATKIVVWTNIGLLAHWIDDELVVFAHDLFSLAPLPNAHITVWSAKNQLMATTDTDAQGFAHIRGVEKSLGLPNLIVAETGDDYTFLRLAARTDDPMPVKDDMPAYDRKGYDAFVYSDRGLYRPGETIHAQWIARTNYGDALAGVPLQFEITNPRGSKLQTSTVTLSALGTGGLDVQTDRAWMTGKYTLLLKVPGAANPVGTLQVNIEDFVPNRIKTEVSIAGSVWNAREDQKITVRAENLFGGPAADRSATGNVILRKGTFELADYKGYSFTNDSEYLAEVLPLGESKTGEDGITTFNFNWPGSPKVSFPINAIVRGEVSELGGRAVSDTKNVTLLTSNKLLGVNVAKGANANQLEVSVAAVQPDGAAAAVPSVRVLLEREDWSYYVRRFSSFNEPKFTKSFVSVVAREVPLVNGRASVALDLPEYSWGYFRVRVSSSTTPMVATQSFYKQWDGIELADTPRPSLIKLVPEQASYNVGDTAKVRIESPFDGRAVVVLQGDNFNRVLTTEVTNGAGEITFPLDDALAPNVWVETTVIHTAPKDRTQVYPYSSFAALSLPVKVPARQIAVSLPGLPEEIRPAQEVQVVVETKSADGTPISADLTLAAVDEGIHGILGYTDPDPWSFLQRERRPDYRRAHYYDRVAYDFTPDAIGGDLAARLSKRSASIGDNWIKPVALWSGRVTTDAEGRATVTLTVPEFNGQLRLVAVAAGATATGATSKQLYVRRPYILQTSIPRFALPGDTFKGRAVVVNTTPAAVTARVSWNAVGAITGGTGESSVEVAPGKDASVIADFAAAAAIGQGAISWKAEIVDAGGQVLDTLVQDMPLPVRPPAAYQSRQEYVVLAAGEKRSFANTAFVEDEQLDTTLTVGNDPALRISNALKSLINYPHGCVEQTTSRCLPLYLFRKSSALVESTLAENERAEAMLQAGIKRLFSMQTSSGGLGYWPGASSPDRYGSVYALHFLALVERDREIPLPAESFKALQDYVRKLCSETSDQSSSGLYLRAYAHYVLALNGDAEALKQIARFDAIEIPSSARYLLAAAIALNTNDAERVKKYLASTPKSEFTDFERGGTLNSAVRDSAVKLLALVQIGAPEKELLPHVDLLTKYLANNNHYITQEAAFVCASLGTYLGRTAQNAGTAQVSISGPEGERTITGNEYTVLRHHGPGANFTVNNTGVVPVYVAIAASGVPTAPVTEASSEGVTLARSVQTKEGTAKEDNTFTQGDTYVISLDVEIPTDVENLVLVDMLPAGFEIENPRLDATEQKDSPDSSAEEGESDGDSGEDGDGDGDGDGEGVDVSTVASSTPSYLDVRDDRLVLAFNKLPGGKHTFRYLVRAVTPGSYQQPGATAECMYDAKVHANLALSHVEVK